MGKRWRNVKVGAGGFCTGIDIANDGTVVTRNDVYGSYIYEPTTGTWGQLITKESMASAGSDVLQPEQWYGGYEFCVSPSVSSRLMIAWSGRMYRSDNSGRTLNDTGLTWDTLNTDEANNGSAGRYMGKRMAIDPTNPDVVYFGTPSSGVYVTFNGGGSWALISTGIIPACSTSTGSRFPGHPGICFDPTSGTTNGRTNTIYIPVYGTGIYRSTNAGSTWASMAGAPTKVRHAKVASDGIYYAASNNSGDTAQTLNKCVGTTWTDITPPAGSDVTGVLIDPSDASRVIAVKDSGLLILSTSRGDGGSWGSVITKTISSPDIPWLAWTELTFMSMGDMVFDPVVPGRIWFACGVGVCTTTFSGNPSSVTWTFNSKGIENLTSNEIICLPNRVTLAAGWDRSVFRNTDPEVYPSTHSPDNTVALRIAWDIDYASSDSSFVAYPSANGVTSGSQDDSRFGWKSTDGGLNWTAFSLPPSGGTIPLWSGVAQSDWLKKGGCIACSTPNNIIIVPANNSLPWYTTDGGTTWTEVNPASWSSGDTGYGFAYFNHMKCVAADRVAANTFYLYNYTNGKIYRSTNSGANWSVMNSAALQLNGAAAIIKAVPGQSGHLFWTFGIKGSAGEANPGGVDFKRSTDGGANWSSVGGGNFDEVTSFGFGLAASGQSYPAIYVAGWKDNVLGIWQSIDNCTSWTSIGDFPVGWLGYLRSIDGSKEIYGTVYAALTNGSYVYRTEAMQQEGTGNVVFGSVGSHVIRLVDVIGT